MKATQLRGLLGDLDWLNGQVHAEDEKEISLVTRARGVSNKRKVDVLTDALTLIAGLKQPDRAYNPEEASQDTEASQKSTDSQLEAEMVEDEKRSQGSQSLSSPSCSVATPSSLLRLQAPSGYFGSPLVPGAGDSPLRTCELGSGAASSSAAAPGPGRPPALAAAGRATRQVRHAYAAWHDGKVLPGCKNFDNETGDKWTETTFPPLLPNLEVARGFTDGAIVQYQQRETTHGTARCHADLGVRIYHDVHERYDFKGPWDGYGKESTDSRRSAVRNRTATINNALLHARHNAKAMARPKQGKSEARWRDYAADNYFHYYYRYGENEKGEPLADNHRIDDLLELAAEPVQSLTAFKHYEGGVTVAGVGAETGFKFARRRVGCYCVPAAGSSCCHEGWTGALDTGFVMPARSGAAARIAAPQAARRSGPSPAFRAGIKLGSLLCVPGDEDDETADGESIWFVNALGPQEKNTETVPCGPCTLVKGHFSVPVQWLNLDELTDEYAIFSVWPTEQDRIAATHFMGMSDLEWAKVEGGKYYMTRAQYDLCNDQL